MSLWCCRLQCTRIYFQTAVSVQTVTVISFTIPPILLKHISELYTVFMQLVSFSVVMIQQRWNPKSCDKAHIFIWCHISHISPVTARLRSLQIFVLILQVNNFSSRKISVGRINIHVMYKMWISSTISTCFYHEICLYWNILLYMQSESRHSRSPLTLRALYSVIIRRTDVNNMHENVKLNKFLRANGW